MTTDLETLQTRVFGAPNLVYVRPLARQELEDLPGEALDSVADAEALFVLSNAEGDRLAIVEGRDAAFAAAKANQLNALSVH